MKRTQWLPSAVTLVLAAVTLMIYPHTVERIDPIVYVQVTATALISVILPLLGRLTKRPFPVLLNALIALHVVLASFLGSAMGFYKRIPWWDLLMHSLFGLVAAVALFILLLRQNGRALGAVTLLLVVFLSVMGLAALWEAFEYTADLVLGGDAQRVLEALKAGTPPIKDTMTDILITVAGVAVFYGGLLVDRLCGYPFTRRMMRS